MNEFERQLRVWRNQIKRWWQDNAPKQKSEKQPDIKMCPSCGRFNDAKATECEFCETLLNPKRKATVFSDGSSSPEVNPVFFVFVICIVAYVALTTLSSSMSDNSFFSSMFNPQGEALMYLGANHPVLVVKHGEWWRIATYSFLHIGVIHIFFNLSALGSLGGMIWAAFGTRRFWLISLLSAIGGGLFSALQPFGFLFGGGGAGFSGALFGYLGALFIYFRQQGQFSVAQRFKNYMVWGNAICIGLTLIGAMMIDNHGHIGGMLTGMGLAYAFQNRTFRSLGDNFEIGLIFACLALYGWGLLQVIGYVSKL